MRDVGKSIGSGQIIYLATHMQHPLCRRAASDTQGLLFYFAIILMRISHNYRNIKDFKGWSTSTYISTQTVDLDKIIVTAQLNLTWVGCELLLFIVSLILSPSSLISSEISVLFISSLILSPSNLILSEQLVLFMASLILSPSNLIDWLIYY